MSYYDPYQGGGAPGQRYVAPGYYGQYYQGDHVARKEEPSTSYEQYAQYQSDFGLRGDETEAREGSRSPAEYEQYVHQQGYVQPSRFAQQEYQPEYQQEYQQYQQYQQYQHPQHTQYPHQRFQHQQSHHQPPHHQPPHPQSPYQSHQMDQLDQLDQHQRHLDQRDHRHRERLSHRDQLGQMDLERRLERLDFEDRDLHDDRLDFQEDHPYQEDRIEYQDGGDRDSQPATPLENMFAPSSSAAPSRTVYLGNIPSDIQPNELLDYVRSGILESVKILPAKNCAFISFIDHQSALLFHSDCILKKLNIKGNDIRIGWGKNSSILPAVMESIQRDGATRNVYLGNLNNPINGETITEAELREDLSQYGVIDCVKIIPEKGIAFIHFLSILSAIRCVGSLPLKEKYLDKKCFYGKDRCAFITKTQQHNAAQYLGLAPGMENIVTAADREFISSALVQQSAAAAQIATQAGGANNLGNRTVYLGNLHQDSTVEEICNVVRGGLLQSIRFLKERHVCFITFIDPIAAAQFFAMCQLHGLTIHNRRIKVGWGKHSGPLSNALSLAVSNGASRNIYVGNITDFEYFHPQKLREDFSKFGDIEQINYLQEKNCAFINFVNIANAIKAIDGIKSFEDYKNLKINFGKDRCGNLPRQFQQQQQQQQQQQHAQQQTQQAQSRQSHTQTQPQSQAQSQHQPSNEDSE
ncbi:RNA-binding protein Mrn1p [[Candida] anglica]|uniref:RNA-binding protein Mrn1p n=1 Tax=[Candida] anglica TaxID=148631 RepID=A0ABP0E905_9ASCO